jgi:hypothetical protein
MHENGGRPSGDIGVTWCHKPANSGTQEPRAPHIVAASTSLRLHMMRLLRTAWSVVEPKEGQWTSSSSAAPDWTCTRRRSPRACGSRASAARASSRSGRFARPPRAWCCWGTGWPASPSRCRDGEHRGVLEALLLAAGGRLPVLAAQRPPPAQRPRPQDRRQGRRLDLPAGRARPGAILVRATQADPPAARPHPLPKGAGPRTHPRGAAAGEAAGRRRDQAVQRGQRHASCVRPGSGPKRRS